MRFEINGTQAYASTGGREPKDGQPWLIFMHGSGSSHLVWTQQSRTFAYAGFNVLAVDFPGHNLSKGEALTTIEAQAEWMVCVMDALEIKTASFVGHSQGGLVALALSEIAADRVEKIAFVATAATIPVNEALISSAETQDGKAKSSMTSWGLGPEAHHYDNNMPGFAHSGIGLRTMDLNTGEALATDLKACAAYGRGLETAMSITCPTLCVFAGNDRMTPLKAGMKLAGALPDNTLHVLEKSGHYVPMEYPMELNGFLREFLA